jgi:hypothetical protein
VPSQQIIDVLLRSPDPSIRWRARVQVLNENERSRPIRALREEVRTSPRVRALLARRTQLGHPGTARAVYYKWQGLHWVLASLADLGYPAGDASLHPIRDRVLDFWLAPSYFTEFVAKTKEASYRRRGVPFMDGRSRRCASQQGNALWSTLRLGIADERAEKLVERLMHWQWPDGGWNCDRRPGAATSSFNETLLPMMGLARYGAERRNRGAARAAARASDVFLKRRLFRRVRDGRVIAPHFVALHYPRYWHYDMLGGLLGMAALEKIRDARCADALDLLESKRLPDGGWPAEKRHHKAVSRTTLRTYADYVDWGTTSPKKMNEWVTVDALSVLVAAGRIRI